MITQQQIDARNMRLKDLGIDALKINKGTISTGSVPGPYYICDCPETNSGIKADVVEIKDVDELKKAGGIPDEAYEYNTIPKHHPVLPLWDCNKNCTDYNTLENEDRRNICSALNAYVFGYSKDYESYRDILNNTYFPMMLPVFSEGTVIVDKDHPLIIKSSTPHQPVGVSFDTVIVKPGGQIICECMANVDILNMIQEEDQNETIPPSGNFCSIGEDGSKGGDGGAGGNGAPGEQGSPSRSGCGSCDVKAGKGGTGGPGNPGQPGKPGGKGQDGAVVNVKVGSVIGNVVLLSSGGNGGIGGNGGNGGKGGEGGLGGAASKHCSQGEQGQGGTGGSGGPAGDGGAGGDGHEVYFNYDTIDAGSTISLGKPKGVGGSGGNGGAAGEGGDGIPKGAGGQGGAGGFTGANGKVGIVYVNGKQL